MIFFTINIATAQLANPIMSAMALLKAKLSTAGKRSSKPYKK